MIRKLVCIAFIGAVVVAGLTPAESSQGPTTRSKTTVAVRRITETQYRHTIADIFSTKIKINARFEPEKRVDGLLALGSSELSLTSSGFEQYFALASSISDQVLADGARTAYVTCQNPAPGDDTCARQFIEKYGRRLFRRPLTDPEVVARIKTASTGAKSTGDFYAGLKLALTSLLVAPEFLFRVETAEADPTTPGRYRLDAYGKASRISFLLWDAAPDDELLAAASSGAIHTAAGLKQHLTRMVASPRFEDGVRAFFADMLQLDGFDNLVKDPAIYPKFNQAVSDSAREQTLKTVVNLLVQGKRDYRDLFTPNETFINRPLASIYRIPFASAAEWAPYTFPESSERSGILTQVAFLSLFSHPGTSSPTKRGIKLLEIFMCEATPDPPADVDFSKVQDSTKGTVRGRLLDHMNNTACAACHRRTDPPGLSLEHFDGLGQLRTMENSARIDVTANLHGEKFEGAQGLGKILRNNPEVPRCLVRRVYAYGAGRKTEDRDEGYLTEQTKAFAGNGYRLPELMMQIGSSPEFFQIVVPAGTQRSASRPADGTGSVQSTRGVGQ